jgi:UDP-N-acetyl-D-mannosaminuronate dehydrogenase
MPKHIAEMAIEALNDIGKLIKDSQVLIMGLAHKEDVADAREAPRKEIIKELREHSIDICGFDLLLNNVEQEFGLKSTAGLEQTKDIGCLILVVVHNDFRKPTLDKLKGIMNDNPILIDVGRFLDREEAERKGICCKGV